MTVAIHETGVSIHPVRANTPDFERLAFDAYNLFMVSMSRRPAIKEYAVHESLNTNINTYVTLDEFNRVISTASLSFVGDGTGILDRVATIPSRRRQRLGSQIIRHIEGVAKVCLDEIHVTSSQMAVPFYESLGYVALEDRPAKLVKKLS